VLDHRYPAVSVETIRHLARQVSEKVPALYAHIGVQARRDAIAILD
jgi:hypothetical protein